MLCLSNPIWTTPQEDNSPPYRFWSWWVVLFHGSGPSGELSWWGIVLGIVVLVGNGWALFLSGGELSSWGVVLEPCKLLNLFQSIASYHGFNSACSWLSVMEYFSESPSQSKPLSINIRKRDQVQIIFLLSNIQRQCITNVYYYPMGCSREIKITKSKYWYTSEQLCH